MRQQLTSQDLECLGKARLGRLVSSLSNIYGLSFSLKHFSNYLESLKDYAVKHRLPLDRAFDEVI